MADAMRAPLDGTNSITHPLAVVRLGSVLIVDDDARIRKLISVGLKRAGYDVTEAVNGREGLERAAEAIPDLIISDVMMPDIDGFAMLSHLRFEPTTQRIPVIMLTAKGDTDDIITGLKLGADDYLAKPFDMSELLARVQAKIDRPPVPNELLSQDRQTGLLSERNFWQEVSRELNRALHGHKLGSVAVIYLDGLAGLRERLGARTEAQIAQQVARLIDTTGPSLDITGRDAEGRFLLLLPETSPEQAKGHLDAIAQRLVNWVWTAGGEQLQLTPTIGFAAFDHVSDANAMRQQALTALSFAAAHLDLQAVRYSPSMGATVDRQPSPDADGPATAGGGLLNRLRLPFQIVLTLLLAIVVPFFVYVLMATYVVDISRVMFLVIVASLLVTGALIWYEGLLALEVVEPPAQPGAPFPMASAIIAAYLPNEAATILETVEAFLKSDYPGPLQVILAYNTPTPLLIEESLQAVARRDPRFVPLKVDHSTSKAQNVNAALGAVRGEFVGVFDADHQPLPDSFTRAWRWLSNGYDVVQGHCLVRNGSASWISRTVAVEFESIYAVAHPGRARMHGFAIFGGSNGYWRTDLLRRTRMHGFMLTEDIDSSMRVIEQGHKIASDPYLVSLELAPTTVKALWNQRMRWAQGWFQVSLKHLRWGLTSPDLSLRQKLGFIHLLGWREIYPWLSPQVFPIIAFWLWHYGAHSVKWLVPIWLLTTLFTLSVGPGQTLFAYLLGAPEIRKHRSWFVWYLIFATIFYTELKNQIARVALIKELMHERAWNVTPRVTSPKEAPSTGAII
ncbi:MAG: hypothetical protein NVS4B8_08450 [Herpetosiphon sp.]